METPSDRLLQLHLATHNAMADNHGKLPDDEHAKNWQHEISRFKQPFFYWNEQPAATYIDNAFNAYDYEAAKATLNHKLYVPIGHAAMRSSISGWAKQAYMGDIIKYLEWNHERADILNNSLDRDKKEFHDVVVDGFNSLINLNYFPLHSLWEAQDAYRRTRVFQLDAIQSGLHRAVGIYYSHTDTIQIANLYENKLAMSGIGNSIGRTVLHEYIHASGKYGGFELHDTSQPQSWRAIDEGFTEHSTVIALDRSSPEPGTVDPSKRRNDTHKITSYHPERKLVQRVLEATNTPANELADIYYSPRNIPQTDRRKRDLLRKIGQKCGGEDVFIKHMLAYENASKVTVRNKIVKKIIKSLE